MKIITTLDHLAINDGTAIAMGTFDGVHKAHMAIINEMLNSAKCNHLKSVVFTFVNIPRHLNDKPAEISQLLSAEEKLQIFESLGIDIVVILPFDEHVKKIKHTTIMSYLLNKLNMKQLYVGFNFKFGYGAEGNAQWLLANCQKYGFLCRIVPLIGDNDGPISSTRIRKYLNEGDIENANALLGRHHFVSGKVRIGKRLGNTIGFPTANLTVQRHMTNIKSGVYITQTTVDKRIYTSVTNVGFNPTFEQTNFNLETYIIDFDDNLYGKHIKVAFLKRIRDELKFGSIEELKEWIICDVNKAKAYIKKLIID